MTDFVRQEDMLISQCKSLQNHIVQCLNDSDDSFHYEEMMHFFRHNYPGLCGWILQTTLEQWRSDSDSGKYYLNFE
jgi:hypothetical protein